MSHNASSESGHGFIYCLGPKCSYVLFLHIHIEIQIEEMFKENELQKKIW